MRYDSVSQMETVDGGMLGGGALCYGGSGGASIFCATVSCLCRLDSHNMLKDGLVSGKSVINNTGK